MASPISVPRSLSELMNGSAELQRIEQLLQALSNLRVRVQMPDGTTAEGTIQIAGTGAVVQCQITGRQLTADTQPYASVSLPLASPLVPTPIP